MYPHEKDVGHSVDYIASFPDADDLTRPPQPTARSITLQHLRWCSRIVLVTHATGLLFALVLLGRITLGSEVEHAGWASGIVISINVVAVALSKFSRDYTGQLNDVRLAEEKWALARQITDIRKRDEALSSLIRQNPRSLRSADKGR